MQNKPTVRTLARRSDAIIACRDLESLAGLLAIRPERLVTLAANPQYREFSIPKKDGSRRLIEDPVPLLKRVQDRLADFLQAVYYFHRTAAAYGFIVRPLDDPEPRHVLNNAKAHLGRPYLLNLDLEDFFHTIHRERVRLLFQAPLLDFPEDLSELLAGLVTYKGRLPMGAPSSPVLSNLVSIPLDQDLQALAGAQELVYTRYADDMSFSSQRPIAEQAMAQIAHLIESWEFRLNSEKKKYFGPDDQDRAVTGLIVAGETVTLPDDYLPTLEAAIYQLSKVIDAQHLTPSGRSADSVWVNDLRRGVFGKIEFARHILGNDHSWLNRLRGAYYDALRPPETYEALSWLEFGYDWEF